MKDKKDRPYAYSVINLLSLWYLLKYYDADYKIDQNKIDGWIDKLRENQADIQLNRENFWEAIAVSD